MQTPIEPPAERWAVLDQGLMNMSVAYKTGRPFCLTYLLDAAIGL